MLDHVNTFLVHTITPKVGLTTFIGISINKSFCCIPHRRYIKNDMICRKIFGMKFYFDAIITFGTPLASSGDFFGYTPLKKIPAAQHGGGD
jgi:hypothetical protein